MTERPRLPLSILGLLAAASGCFDSTNTAPPTPDAGPLVADAATVGDAAASDDAAPVVTGDATTGSDAGPSVAPGIYVSQAGDQVLVFGLDATGNTAPLRTLAGADTGLALPIGVAVNRSGNLYVANRMGAGVTVYGPTASGDAAPIRTLTAMGMQSAQGVVVGKDGDVFVSTCPSCGPSGGGDTAIFHFPANATQSDYSIIGDNTGFTDPGSIAMDPAQDLVVGNAFGGLVSTFAPGATGDVAPLRSFTPTPTTNLQALALADGTLFLSTPGVPLSLFSPTSTGSATPAATFSGAASLTVQYPGGVAVDTSATPPVVYLVDYGGAAIYMIQTTGSAPLFGAGAVTSLTGPATSLQSPLDVVIVR